MRLISINILCCRVKNCKGGEKSLELKVDKFEEVKKDLNREALLKMLDMMDWVLIVELSSIIKVNIPDNRPSEIDDDLMNMLHRLIFEIDILEGNLKCSSCDRLYPIIDGIPNLILDDKEI